MYEEIRKYTIKLNKTSPEHQIKIVELLEKVGEKVYATTRVRWGKGGNSLGYFTYHEGDWSINGVLPSKGQHIVIDSIELIEKLENYLHNLSTSHPNIKIGTVYINSAGSECIIESIVGDEVNYMHEGGRQYTTSKSNIQTKWKLKENPNTFKYRPGDKVRVSPDLRANRYYKMLNSDKEDLVTTTMMCYKGQIVTIKSITPSGKYTIEDNDSYWTDEMFQGLAEDIGVSAVPLESEVPKYLDRPAQVGDYVERTERVENFLQEFDSTINKVVYLSPSGFPGFKNDGSFYIKEYFKVINPLHPSHPEYGAKDIETPVEAKQPLIKETKINQKSEKTKMAAKKDLKEAAAVTVGQNKEALIIASKMEAGKILTKQVLKQVKPHVPMLLRGYLDTPLAPVILANAVAMVGNHTENKRVQQVAELMLLSAASETVGAFNLDKIIDDVLSNVKLPAGVLDGDDE